MGWFKIFFLEKTSRIQSSFFDRKEVTTKSFHVVQKGLGRSFKNHSFKTKKYSFCKVPWPAAVAWRLRQKTPDWNVVGSNTAKKVIFHPAFNWIKNVAKDKKIMECSNLPGIVACAVIQLIKSLYSQLINSSFIRLTKISHTWNFFIYNLFLILLLLRSESQQSQIN